MTQLRVLRRSEPGDDDLVAAFVDRFGLKSTRAKYRLDLRRLRRFLNPRGVTLAGAGRSDLEAYIRELGGSGLAENTVASAVRVASSFYTWAENESHVARSPLRGVRRPKVPTSSSTLGLDVAECHRLLDAALASGWRDRLLICLLLLSGLRVSEACSARIENLDVSDGRRVLRIRRKGGDLRWIPLPAPTFDAVDAHLAERGSPRRGPLVGNLRFHDRRLTEAAAAKALRRVAANAGIARRVHPHALRHSFITQSLNAGVPLRDVQDSADHASPATTRRYDRDARRLERHASHVLVDYLGLGPGGRQLHLGEAAPAEPDA